MNALQEQLKKAYPETVSMALETGENPKLSAKEAIRVRFHSVGCYGTIASGKLLTDILAAVLGLHSKSAPKYGSEKSGTPTNFYLTLSPEPIKITNAQLEEVEIVISPDHKVFEHTNPLNGLVEGGTSGEDLLEIIQQQVNKKFGAKGPEVVRSNMLVLERRDGIHSGGRLPPPGIHRNHSF